MYAAGHLKDAAIKILIITCTATILCETLSMDTVIFSVWKCDSERNEADEPPAAKIDVIETNWIPEPHLSPDPTCLQVNYIPCIV